MKTVKKQLGEWLVQQMAQTSTSNVDIVEAFAKKGDRITSSYVSNMRGIGMSLNKANEVADVLGWPKPTVVNGLVLMQSSEDQTSKEEGLELDNEDNQTHIIISSLTPQAGCNEANNTYEILDKIQVSKPWLHATYPHLNNLHSLALCEIKGDSMEPTFHEKDTILIDTATNTVTIDGVYVFTYHDTLLIKRIQRIPGLGYSVISDNKEFYEPFNIPNEDLENLTVHGRVVGKFGFNKI